MNDLWLWMARSGRVQRLSTLAVALVCAQVVSDLARGDLGTVSKIVCRRVDACFDRFAVRDAWLGLFVGPTRRPYHLSADALASIAHLSPQELAKHYQARAGWFALTGLDVATPPFEFAKDLVRVADRRPHWLQSRDEVAALEKRLVDDAMTQRRVPWAMAGTTAWYAIDATDIAPDEEQTFRQLTRRRDGRHALWTATQQHDCRVMVEPPPVVTRTDAALLTLIRALNPDALVPLAFHAPSQAMFPAPLVEAFRRVDAEMQPSWLALDGAVSTQFQGRQRVPREVVQWVLAASHPQVRSFRLYRWIRVQSALTANGVIDAAHVLRFDPGEVAQARVIVDALAAVASHYVLPSLADQRADRFDQPLVLRRQHDGLQLGASLLPLAIGTAGRALRALGSLLFAGRLADRVSQEFGDVGTFSTNHTLRTWAEADRAIGVAFDERHGVNGFLEKWEKFLGLPSPATTQE